MCDLGQGSLLNGSSICNGIVSWAPDGFAAIPIAAIDPPQRAASPAVPALLGPGPPCALSRLARERRRHFGDLLKLDKQLWLILLKVTRHAVIGDQLAEISLYDGEVQMILAV